MREILIVCLVMTLAWLLSLTTLAAHRAEQQALRADRVAEYARISAMLAD